MNVIWSNRVNLLYRLSGEMTPKLATPIYTNTKRRNVKTYKESWSQAFFWINRHGHEGPGGKYTSVDRTELFDASVGGDYGNTISDNGHYGLTNYVNIMFVKSCNEYCNVYCFMSVIHGLLGDNMSPKELQ